MRIKQIQIRRFKAIESVDFSPDSVNILIGGNNSGKSSFLQAVQFAVSVIQAVYSLPKRKKFKNDELSATLSFGALNYSPAKVVTSLAYGNSSLGQSPEKQISIKFICDDDDGIETIGVTQVKLGKNGNLLVKLIGEKLCKYISSTDHNFCMYVPGLAGVPFDEAYQANGAVRRAAAKGDANTILRNILLRLQDNAAGWASFIDDVNLFFPNTSISVIGHLDDNGIIEVLVNSSGIKKSLETVGTGLLQTIQLSAYIHFYQPNVLLLDEPDSHLHANNQALLSNVIEKFANPDRIIIIATHSRHLLSALRSLAKVSVFKSGGLEDFVGEYQILFDLGALDKYDVFRDPNVKYVVLIEETKLDSKQLIELLLQASGFPQNSYVIQSYNSSSQAPSAIFVASCLSQLRNDLHIIVHSDRDGRTDDEIATFREKFAAYHNLRVFVTTYNDIEGYFCTPAHVAEVLESKGITITAQEAQNIVDLAFAAVEERCLETYLNRVLDPMREQGRGVESEARRRYFLSHKQACMNGHFITGALKQELHQQYHVSEKEFFSSTNALFDDSLNSIFQEFETMTV